MKFVAWSVGFELPDLDTAGFGLIDRAIGEGDDDLAAAVCGGGECLHQGLVGSDGGVDIEVGEHGRAVDGDVEFTLAGGSEIGFGEMQ